MRSPTTPSSRTTPSRSSRRVAQLSAHRPTTRTIVGALLVSTAGLGAFLAMTASSSTQRQTLIVANRAIAIGERIDSSAVSTTSIETGSPLAGHGFADPASVIGGVALAPLAEGELVQRSAVLTGAPSEPAREFSFPVDRERSLNGDLRAGERVDVLATYGSGTDATTTVLARDARVIRITDAKSGALGSSGKLILTLALSSADQLLDAAHAAQVASMTIVRSTLAEGTTGTRSATTGPLSRATIAR